MAFLFWGRNLDSLSSWDSEPQIQEPGVLGFIAVTYPITLDQVPTFLQNVESLPHANGIEDRALFPEETVFKI